MFPCRALPLLSRHLPPPRVSIRAPVGRDMSFESLTSSLYMFQTTRPLGRDTFEKSQAFIVIVSIHAPVRARPYVYIIPKNLAAKRRAARNGPYFRPKIKRRKKTFPQRLGFRDLALARNSRKKTSARRSRSARRQDRSRLKTTASLPRTRRAVRLQGNKDDASLLRTIRRRNDYRQTSRLNRLQRRSISSIRSKISATILQKQSSSDFLQRFSS